MPMEIVINGRTREIADGSTIWSVVELLGYASKQVVAEHNGEPIERERFRDVVLQPGDALEVVRAVAGG
jgi:sulfur carrier protein